MDKTNKSSAKFSMNAYDWQRWMRNTLLFSAPAILAVLVSLQAGTNMDIAIGAGYQAALAATIDLIKKFLDENN